MYNSIITKMCLKYQKLRKLWEEWALSEFIKYHNYIKLVNNEVKIGETQMKAKMGNI